MDKDPLTDTAAGMSPYQMPAMSTIMPGASSGVSGMPGMAPISTLPGMPMVPGTAPVHGMPPVAMPGMMPLPGMPYMPGMHPMDEEMMEMRYIVALLMLHIDMCIKHMHMYHGM
ncbi:hypothetical protein SAMN02746089_00767 [Caldanaerobius fijiensis DSM 17918]|uniref:Uncharacterized protein n=1 Tax=Caldanaerobius fijiensis DSM 17918 TaxID=1121256 RepID=A0A1M4W662_9THEO|nr:hypothetical protein [Caldanaerobius fijiensis]SHE76689.1 hypothetical protein SAMN02746089_00767 [Caldanaerobius fijiensis DSM 17918]